MHFGLRNATWMGFDLGIVPFIQVAGSSICIEVPIVMGALYFNSGTGFYFIPRTSESSLEVRVVSIFLSWSLEKLLETVVIFSSTYLLDQYRPVYLSFPNISHKCFHCLLSFAIRSTINVSVDSVVRRAMPKEPLKPASLGQMAIWRKALPLTSG